MPSINLTSDPMVSRLRWVMLATMLFSMTSTLAGQPDAFWLNPKNAIRGDGLRLHNHLNHTFEFFLSFGWQPYVISCMIYFTLAFVLVSILPPRPALIAVFSFIFGHFYGGCNWLGNHWHLGFTGVTWYSVILSAAVAFSLSPFPRISRQQIVQLRWVAVITVLFDFLLTSLGQPAAYWHNPQMVHEGNSLIRWFLERGWGTYALMELLLCLGLFFLASSLPRFSAIMFIFGFTFGFFDGASSWLFYERKLGMQAPVIYGTVLSAIVVFLLFSRRKTITHPYEVNASLTKDDPIKAV
jgi:uncharacterized membrane protein YczE